MSAFGWRPSTDPRNDDHLARAVLPSAVGRRTKLWTGPYLRLDQGRESACVGFGWTIEAMSTPVRVRPAPYTLDGCNQFALARYHEAQLVDEFPDTPPAGGSSVNAGAKVMRTRGYIAAWKWHRSPDDVIDALIADGPQVMGSSWLAGMERPDANGIIRATGDTVGGHCYTLTGYYTSWHGAEAVRLRNSWGNWAHNGDAYLPVTDLRTLWDIDAECAMPIGRTYGGTS